MKSQTIEEPEACNSLHLERPKKNLFFELFVALSLSVAFFFLVRPCFLTGNPINRFAFTSGSENLYQLKEPIMGAVWNGRLAALLLSGAAVDTTLNVSNNSAPEQKFEQLANAFGLYHGLWLFCLFVMIIFACPHSLLINLGVMAGLVYDFSPTSGPYFYAWDIPTMFFATAAVVFFDQKHIWLMVVTIYVGCFFKETVLVCSLFLLFIGVWPWKKRILVFFGLILTYFLGKGLLLNGLHLQAPLSSVSSALTLHGGFSFFAMFENLAANLRVLFSPTINSIIFTNAGTLVAALALCWKRQFLPYMTVLGSFVLATFLLAPPPGVGEVRDFMQVLPLCLMMLAARWAGTVEERPSLSSGFGMARMARNATAILSLGVGLLMFICSGVSVWQYFVIYKDVNAIDPALTQLGKYPDIDVPHPPSTSLAGYVNDELNLAAISTTNEETSDAITHYNRALELDATSVEALNNLAWMLATCPQAHLRDGARAVQLAERACKLTNYRRPILIGTLAAAEAEDRRFDDAVIMAKQAIALAQAEGDSQVDSKNEQLLELYKSDQAYHQDARTH